MSLFKEAVNEQAYVKCGMLGFPASGKTFTTMQWIFGLKERTGSNAPICFFDTETGSDFFVSECAQRGIRLLQVKSRAFTDAIAAYDEAISLGADVIVFDSVTHVWRELCDTYAKKKNITRIEFQHWRFLKGPDGWQKFTDKFLNAPIHTFICGRAGYEYDYEKNEEGKRELVRTGTKMKAEGEFGYEPSLLVEMERVKADGVKGWSHRMTILKDRTNTINGREFEFTADMVHKDPRCVFTAVEPHFARLNIGGTQLGIDQSRTSDSLFADGEARAETSRREKQMILEEIYGLIEAEWPGMEKDAKARRNEVFTQISEFAGSKLPKSKTAFESLGLTAIKKAHTELCLRINEDRRNNGVAPEHLLAIPEYANQDVTVESEAA